MSAICVPSGAKGDDGNDDDDEMFSCQESTYQRFVFQVGPKVMMVMMMMMRCFLAKRAHISDLCSKWGQR